MGLVRLNSVSSIDERISTSIQFFRNNASANATINLIAAPVITTPIVYPNPICMLKQQIPSPTDPAIIALDFSKFDTCLETTYPATPPLIAQPMNRTAHPLRILTFNNIK